MTVPLVPDGVSVRRDVVHTRVEGYRPLALDLYLPDDGAQAVCVYLHGGGWRVGSRRSGPGPMSPTSSRWLARLAQRGLAVVAVDYRLSGEAQFPAQSHDVAAAIHWLRHDADESLGVQSGGVQSGGVQSGGLQSGGLQSGGLQSGGVGFVGHLPVTVFGVSAGGLLAGLAALDPELDLAAAALWYAVTDIASMPEDQTAVGSPLDPPGESREDLLIGCYAADVPDRARAASPVHQVHAGAPPFFLLHGDADVLVPPRQSERLHEALQAAGTRATLQLVPGYNHMFATMPDDEVSHWLDLTADFLLSP